MSLSESADETYFSGTGFDNSSDAKLAINNQTDDEVRMVRISRLSTANEVWRWVGKGKAV